MNTFLRILFTAPGYKPAYQIGGPILSVSSLAEALVKKGHSVTVFTTNCNMSEELDVPVDCPQIVDGVEVWYFRRREIIKKMLPFVPYLSKSMGYLYTPAMADQLQRAVPTMDLVHTHLPFIYPTFAGARAARMSGKPLFYHQRGVFDPARLNFRSLKKRLFLKLFEKPNLNSATTLVALTDYEVESYRRLCPSGFCRLIPNGIDVKQYRTKPNDPNVMNLRPESTVILFLGRLHPIKGADRLLDAFIKVSNHFSDLTLVMGGPDEYALENKFRFLVTQKNLENRIVFPGMVTGEIKKDLLARADLFCLPSEAEGFSMAVLESLASGTPVMISPGCHFPEVEIAGAGKVVEAESELMANTLMKMLMDKESLVRMGRNGRNLVAHNYSWEIVADKMTDMYQEGIRRFILAR